jgi:hypothetical protein
MNGSFTDSLSGFALWVWLFLAALGFIGSALFPVLYHHGSHGAWRHTEMGRHLMAFSVAVGYALLALLLRIALGDYPGRAVVNYSAIVGLVGVTWWRSILYIRTSRQDRRRDRDLV